MIQRAILSILILSTWLISLSLAKIITLNGMARDIHTQKPLDSVVIQVIDSAGSSITQTLSKPNGQWSLQLNLSGIDEFSDSENQTLQIFSNYPNPFRSVTTIPFSLPHNEMVRISAYNILGKCLDHQSYFLKSGHYQINWQSLGGPSVILLNVTVNGKTTSIKMLQLDSGSGGFNTPPTRKSFQTDIQSGIEKTVSDSARPYMILACRFDYFEDSAFLSSSNQDTIRLNLESIHQRSFFIDLHNDILERTYGMDYDWGIRHTSTYHTDIPRLQEGGVDAQFFVLWVDPDYTTGYFDIAQGFLKTFQQQISHYSQSIAQARNETEIMELNQAGKIAAVLAAEGGHILENDIGHLIELYQQGVRYMTITWNNSTDWAISAQDSRSETRGLSNFGREVIHTMDSLGMIIDVSHTGIQTIRDILDETHRPIIASHSGAYAIRAHYRNLKDDQIIAIAQQGGVIGVVFYPSFLSRTGKADIETVIQHIDYIVNLVGIDHVAIGSDFDGIETVPQGLENVSAFPNLTRELLRHGYLIYDIQKILGQNFLRVWREATVSLPGT